MSMRPMGEAMMISWAGLGLKIEKDVETQERWTVYISVPERSELLNVDGIEMAGEHLKKRFKKVMCDMGVKRLVVMARTRKGERWTKADKEAAELEMRKMIYGSQY